MKEINEVRPRLIVNSLEIQRVFEYSRNRKKMTSTMMRIHRMPISYQTREKGATQSRLVSCLKKGDERRKREGEREIS